MIKITAKSIVKAGAREEFIATARELVENSRAEAGNISYHLYEDIDADRRFLLVSADDIPSVTEQIRLLA